MLRTALRPRWLALLALVLLAATGMSLLGRWQLDRAREHGAAASAREAARASDSTPRPVQDVLPPRTTFTRLADGARVTATGTWDGARQLLIADRKLNGRNGFWVLTPLRLDDGSTVGVVRGWVVSAQDPASRPPASGQRITVTGLLRPTEPPVERDPGQGSGLPSGQLEAVAITDLINVWPYPLLITGYVLAQSEQPALGVVPHRIPPPAAGTGLDWLNLGYAIQWWLFAGFGLFMWWRVVRDDHLSHSRTGQDEPVHRHAEGVSS